MRKIIINYLEQKMLGQTRSVIMLIFFYMGTSSILAQVENDNSITLDLDSGFELLEIGKFEEARQFFASALQVIPESKTARICYGRALGLSGEPVAALDLFIDMSYRDKEDLEISLNLAEAYLWNNLHSHALVIYDSLLLDHPNNFTAMLGRSNSLAGMKKNRQAFSSIQDAIELKPGDPGAEISEKYIGMAYAYDLGNRENRPDSALVVLDQLLTRRLQDIDLNMAKASILAKMKRYSEAEKIYIKMDQNNAAVLLGQSRTLVMKGDLAGSLLLAEKAFSIALGSDDKLVLSDAIAHLHSIRLMNRNYSEAEALLHMADSIFPNTSQTGLSKAQFEMYTAQYNKGFQTFETILSNDPASFGANLGSANALHALGLDKAAYRKSFHTLSLYPGQQDTHSFIEKLHAIHSPYINVSSQVFRDSDNSITHNHFVSFEGSIDPQIRLRGSFQKRTSGSLTSRAITKSDHLNAEIDITLNGMVKMKALGGVFLVKDENQRYHRWLGELSTNLRLNSVHSISLGLRREQQDFNRNLILQDLTMNHLFIRSNMYWVKSAWGWYTEYFHTLQSDRNQRKLLFTSLYKNLTPIFKGGFNLQYMSFNRQVPDQYFSPEDLRSVEVFAQIDKPIFKSSGNLGATLATGYRLIKTEIQPSFRARVSFNKRFGEKWNLGIYAMYDASAERISNGFTYYGGGINIRYRLSQLPVFTTFKRYTND